MVSLGIAAFYAWSVYDPTGYGDSHRHCIVDPKKPNIPVIFKHSEVHLAKDREKFVKKNGYIDGTR